MEQRVQREKRFHDHAYADRRRQALAAYYCVNERCRAQYLSAILERCVDLRVLELGCGVASSVPALARRGAVVTGIDVSDVAIDLVRENARLENLQVEYRVMDAEHTEFDDATFDLICGAGILHHLNLASALREVSRVLRCGGRAVFLEPLGHNPVINLFRGFTPDLRTADEHPLRTSDFELARRFFRDVEISYHALTSLVAVPFVRTRAFPAVLSVLDRFDQILFRWLPFVRRFAWCAVIVLRRPARCA